MFAKFPLRVLHVLISELGIAAAIHLKMDIAAQEKDDSKTKKEPPGAEVILAFPAPVSIDDELGEFSDDGFAPIPLRRQQTAPSKKDSVKQVVTKTT